MKEFSTYKADKSDIRRPEQDVIVDFEVPPGDVLTHVISEKLNLADLETSLFVKYTLHPESEPYQAIRSHFQELLKTGLLPYGEGQVSTYSVIDSTVSRFPRITEKIGVLRIRTQKKRNRLTGQQFESTFSTAEKSRPMDEFMHGAATQSIAYLKPGVLVPKPYIIIEHMGATDLATGEIIPETEELVTGAYFIMEHIPGLTPLQICDPDGSLINQFLAVRKNGDCKRVFDQYGERIRSNIRKTVEENPYLLEIDFDAALEDLKSQVEALHATVGNIPGILHCDLHDGNIVFHPEKKRFTIIDFGEAKVAYSDDSYGREYEDYQHYGKTGPNGEPAMYMPDGPYEFQSAERLNSMKPTHALEYIRGFLFQIKKVIKEMKSE